MKDRPILFSGEMVRAILDGRKTQTRRIARPLLGVDLDAVVWHAHEEAFRPWLVGEIGDPILCPYGVPGDRLWVRETWSVLYPQHVDSPDEPTFYRADYTEAQQRELILPSWRPSIFMKRARSRITLEIVGVRVERLQDITDEDAKAEGVYPAPFCEWFAPGNEHKEKFASLWGAINGKRAPWDSNPWVWVVEFKRAEAMAVAA